MIELKALVVDGVVQGFGDSDEGAYSDACSHGIGALVADIIADVPGATECFVPWARARGLFVPITIEDAKRISKGDTFWPVRLSS